MLQRATNHVAHIGYFVALFISTYSIPALPLDLNNAQLVTRTTPVTWDEHIEYYLSTGFPGVTYAYFTFDAASEIYITLNDKNELSKLRASRESDKNFKFTYDVLKKWPLTRWPHQYYSPFIKEQYDELYTEYPPPFKYEGLGPRPGCMGDAPLRYGDIENDGKDEIILILNGLFILFSPDYQRTVFAAYLDESDWYNGEQMAQFFPRETFSVAQYLSQLWSDNDYKGPGVRAYAKLYFGDFNDNEQPDILLWQKNYRSLAGTNPTKGFSKLSDHWIHYERNLEAQEQSAQGITGEYLPQSTTQDTIQQWLADRQLTWKAGYPGTSECQGEEGQLIPEMHDPLLNDPEVLQ